MGNEIKEVENNVKPIWELEVPYRNDWERTQLLTNCIIDSESRSKIYELLKSLEVEADYTEDVTLEDYPDDMMDDEEIEEFILKGTMFNKEQQYLSVLIFEIENYAFGEDEKHIKLREDLIEGLDKILMEYVQRKRKGL